MKRCIFYFCACILFGTMLSSCIEERNYYQGDDDDKDDDKNPSPIYIYPFGQESESYSIEIIIETDGTADLNSVEVEFPNLKYNKDWLFLFTQDDCAHAAYCYTWAAIHGKPLSSNASYYYHSTQLEAGDIPPRMYYLEKTLGSTDGAGNEVRFSPTTTISPEEEFMKAKVTVNKGYTGNYYRFYKSSGLVWEDVAEMVNYGAGIAFHDVDAPDVNNPTSILEHYKLAQDVIVEELSGRGSKMLAEPNGNKNYVTAAMDFEDIQIMTLQSGGSILYPWSLGDDDLYKALLERQFLEPEAIKNWILSGREREAIHVGVHSTADDSWIEFLEWLNDTYGKDGDDSVWFPSLEEYYEYNYNRIHATIEQKIEGNKIIAKIHMPGNKHFYFPSTTINFFGLDESKVIAVETNESVKGMSYGKYEYGTMVNVNCRKYLVEHATHFVEKYEKDKTNKSNKDDAIYFVSQLKDSETKTSLLNRLK